MIQLLPTNSPALIARALCCRVTRRLTSRVRGLKALACGAALAASTGLCGAAAPANTANYVDLSLEQLMDLKVERVYGVSRQVQKVTQAPSSVSIVTADEIQQFGWNTLAEILRSVRGFYSSDDRNYSYLGVRGFLRPGDYNTRMLVLIDGHRMNDNIYDGSYIGREEPIATDLIERVEVIRGPSSSVYGSSAFLGVINIVTKRPTTDFVQVSTEAGNNATFENRVTVNRMFRNGVQWLTSATHYTSAGDDRIYFPEFDQRRSSHPGARDNGVAADRDAEHAVHLYSSLKYADFTLSGFVSRRKKEIPTASYGTVFNHGGEHTVDRRGYLDLKFDRQFGPHRLQGRLFFDQYRYTGAYPFDYAEPGDPPLVMDDRDYARGEWIGAEWQLTAQLSPRSAVVAGFEVRDNLRENQNAVFGGEQIVDSHRSSKTLGVFSQWDVRLRKNLLLSVGLRHDHYYHAFGGTTNPRVALIYTLTEATTLKALYGRAFRAPNPYERDYYSAQGFQGPLRPERITTQELVLEHYWGRSYRASVSLYHYDLNDLITQNSFSPAALYFENVERTHAEGGELELEAKYDSGWLARASVAVQHAKDRTREEQLTSSPGVLSKLNVAWAPPKKPFSIGVEVQYQSTSRTLAGEKAGDFVLTNVHLLRRQVFRSFDLSLTATNASDVKYDAPGGEDLAQDLLGQPRRAIRLKLTRRF